MMPLLKRYRQNMFRLLPLPFLMSLLCPRLYVRIHPLSKQEVHPRQPWERKMKKMIRTSRMLRKPVMTPIKRMENARQPMRKVLQAPVMRTTMRKVLQALVMRMIKWNKLHPQGHHRKESSVLCRLQLRLSKGNRLQRSDDVNLQLHLPAPIPKVVILKTPSTLIYMRRCGSRLPAPIMYANFFVFIYVFT